MIEVPEWMEGAGVTFELDGLDEAAAEEIREILDGPEDEVVYSHAFGGAALVAVATVLTGGGVAKLIEALAKLRGAARTTRVKVGKQGFEMAGLSVGEMQTLLATPGFQKAVKELRAR